MFLLLFFCLPLVRANWYNYSTAQYDTFYNTSGIHVYYHMSCTKNLTVHSVPVPAVSVYCNSRYTIHRGQDVIQIFNGCDNTTHIARGFASLAVDSNLNFFRVAAYTKIFCPLVLLLPVSPTSIQLYCNKSLTQEIQLMPSGTVITDMCVLKNATKRFGNKSCDSDLVTQLKCDEIPEGVVTDLGFKPLPTLNLGNSLCPTVPHNFTGVNTTLFVDCMYNDTYPVPVVLTACNGPYPRPHSCFNSFVAVGYNESVELTLRYGECSGVDAYNNTFLLSLIPGRSVCSFEALKPNNNTCYHTNFCGTAYVDGLNVSTRPVVLNVTEMESFGNTEDTNLNYTALDFSFNCTPCVNHYLYGYWKGDRAMLFHKGHCSAHSGFNASFGCVVKLSPNRNRRSVSEFYSVHSGPQRFQLDRHVALTNALSIDALTCSGILLPNTCDDSTHCYGRKEIFFCSQGVISCTVGPKTFNILWLITILVALLLTLRYRFFIIVTLALLPFVVPRTHYACYLTGSHRRVELTNTHLLTYQSFANETNYIEPLFAYDSLYSDKFLSDKFLSDKFLYGVDHSDKSYSDKFGVVDRNSHSDKSHSDKSYSNKFKPMLKSLSDKFLSDKSYSDKSHKYKFYSRDCPLYGGDVTIPRCSLAQPNRVLLQPGHVLNTLVEGSFKLPLLGSGGPVTDFTLNQHYLKYISLVVLDDFLINIYLGLGVDEPVVSHLRLVPVHQLGCFPDCLINSPSFLKVLIGYVFPRGLASHVVPYFPNVSLPLYSENPFNTRRLRMRRALQNFTANYSIPIEFEVRETTTFYPVDPPMLYVDCFTELCDDSEACRSMAQQLCRVVEAYTSSLTLPPYQFPLPGSEFVETRNISVPNTTLYEGVVYPPPRQRRAIVKTLLDFGKYYSCLSKINAFDMCSVEVAPNIVLAPPFTTKLTFALYASAVGVSSLLNPLNVLSNVASYYGFKHITSQINTLSFQQIIIAQHLNNVTSVVKNLVEAFNVGNNHTVKYLTIMQEAHNKMVDVVNAHEQRISNMERWLNFLDARVQKLGIDLLTLRGLLDRVTYLNYRLQSFNTLLEQLRRNREQLDIIARVCMQYYDEPYGRCGLGKHVATYAYKTPLGYYVKHYNLVPKNMTNVSGFTLVCVNDTCLATPYIAYKCNSSDSGSSNVTGRDFTRFGFNETICVTNRTYFKGRLALIDDFYIVNSSSQVNASHDRSVFTMQLGSFDEIFRFFDYRYNSKEHFVEVLNVLQKLNINFTYPSVLADLNFTTIYTVDINDNLWEIFDFLLRYILPYFLIAVGVGVGVLLLVCCGPRVISCCMRRLMHVPNHRRQLRDVIVRLLHDDYKPLRNLDDEKL